MTPSHVGRSLDGRRPFFSRSGGSEGVEAPPAKNDRLRYDVSVILAITNVGYRNAFGLFRTVSDGFGWFRIVFGPFRIVFGSFWFFFDRFRIILDFFPTVFGRLRS